MNLKRTEGTFQPSPSWENTVILTVDVEDYFMSPECIPFDRWSSFDSRIHVGMERVLALLQEYNAKATFFFLGWVAEHHPELVRLTAEQGHEIATHTYDHRFVSSLSPNDYAESVQKSISILKNIVPAQTLIGHRAPAFSLDRDEKWPFDVLLQNGILYDSSINPHSTYLYGDRTAPRFPYRLHGMIEIPPAAIHWAGLTWPVGGGGTLRILPEGYLRLVRNRYQREGYPPVIYIHPWEFVPDHPPIDLPLKLHLVHWTGIRSTGKKIRAILQHNQTITMAEYYTHLMKENEL